MANAKTKTEKDTAAPGKDLATQQTALPAVMLNEGMFAADAGAGMEGATQESFAIPFLGVLQKGSPQVDEASGAALEGAKAGMFFENVTGRMYDGKKGVLVVPCAYRRVFLRWAPKGMSGSGFKGEMTVDEVATLRANGTIKDLDGRLYFPLEDGTVNDKKCDRVADVRNHYVLLIDEASGSWTQALLSLGSTQIKKSKALMAALASVKIVNPGNGQMYTPPTFANLVRVTSVPESNDKGTWFGVRFEVAGRVQRTDVYGDAKAFNSTVRSGNVEARYDEMAPGANDGGGRGTSGAHDPDGSF